MVFTHPQLATRLTDIKQHQAQTPVAQMLTRDVNRHHDRTGAGDDVAHRTTEIQSGLGPTIELKSNMQPGFEVNKADRYGGSTVNGLGDRPPLQFQIWRTPKVTSFGQHTPSQGEGGSHLAAGVRSIPHAFGR